MFKDDDIFIMTEKEVRKNVAPHNLLRWLWIGAGKTYKEINQIGSVYRTHGIVRQNYDPVNGSIYQDLKYDIKNGWIKWYRKGSHLYL